MNRKELIRRTASLMREKDIRKPVSMPKQVFHISDDEGNTRDFTLRKIDKSVIFTADDVEAIIDSCIEVIMDALRHGEEISIRGFGTLGLKYRKKRSLIHVGTGEQIEMESHYSPKFTSGNDLRTCAKVYEMYLKENQILPAKRSPAHSEDGE